MDYFGFVICKKDNDKFQLIMYREDKGKTIITDVRDREFERPSHAMAHASQYLETITQEVL